MLRVLNERVARLPCDDAGSAVRRVVRAPVLLAALLGARAGTAQAPCGVAPPRPVASRPPFELQRAEEEWGPATWGTGPVPPAVPPLKAVPLGRAAQLTLGGDFRLYPERFAWEEFGRDSLRHDAYLQLRTMVHADVRIAPWNPRAATAGHDVAWAVRPRVFVQLRSGLVDGRRGSPRPPDTDTLGVHQLFVELGFARTRGACDREADHPAAVSLRVGRQEFYYGAARLLHVREGPNVRQSFDAVRLIVRGPRVAGRATGWRADLFAATVAPTRAGVLDDGRDPSRRLWGSYLSGPLPGATGASLDLYYLGHARARAAFAQGTGRERRHTIGVRLADVRALGATVLGWDVEPMVQWGRVSIAAPEAPTVPRTGRIRAWTVATETRWQHPRARFAPLLALRADAASGDRDPADPDLQTFHPLYPRGNYFGQFSPVGPANFVDLHPRVELATSSRTTLTLEWLAFWRLRRGDGVYDAVGAPFLPLRSTPAEGAAATRARFVGHMPAAALEWLPSRHVTMMVQGGTFTAGPYARATSPGRRIGYLAGALALRY